ncbi:MAG: hypothetical protein ACFCU5_08745 [Pleurocapsa sp.]
MSKSDNFEADYVRRNGEMLPPFEREAADLRFSDRDKLLQKLLEKAQKSNNNRQQKSIIVKIVSIVMRSRPLCRQFNGTPLTGVYREIYDLVEHQLMYSITQKLAQNNFNKLNSDELYKMQNQIFKQILDDERLKKLGLAAQKYLPNSELRSYALTELVKAIKLSGKLCRPHSYKFSYNFYQILYEEAITETLAHICLNIDSYDPERKSKKFMNWVNFKLDKFVLKCYENYLKFNKYNLPSVQDLEQISQPEKSIHISDLLFDYLERDPEKIFQTTHIRNRPDANFQAIALAKLNHQNWEIISAKFNIPVSSLSSFYNRWCRRFAPLIERELNQYL